MHTSPIPRTTLRTRSPEERGRQPRQVLPGSRRRRRRLVHVGHDVGAGHGVPEAGAAHPSRRGAARVVAAPTVGRRRRGGSARDRRVAPAPGRPAATLGPDRINAGSDDPIAQRGPCHCRVPDSQEEGRLHAPTAPKPVKFGNAAWWAPVMVAFFVIGLLWIVVYYITRATTCRS